MTIVSHTCRVLWTTTLPRRTCSSTPWVIVSQIFPLSSLGEEVPTSHPHLLLPPWFSEWVSGFLDWTYYCLVAYYDGAMIIIIMDFRIVSWPYTVMRISTYTHFHMLNIYMYSIYEAQQHRKEVLDCQKVACKYINNASIYSSPIYSNNNNNLLHGWLILHEWTFFSSKEWNFGKNALVNSM
jgi:hypothetical protein